jgi:hypothetical protein
MKKTNYIAFIFFWLSMTLNAADISTIDGDWEIDYRHDIVPIMYDGLTIPIETTAPTLELVHKSLGFFSFVGGKMNSVSSIPSAGLEFTDASGSPITTFQHRPTLFISIGGAKLGNPLKNPNGKGVANWQKRMNGTDLTSQIHDLVNEDHQVAYMYVDWYSMRKNRSQVKALAKHVKNFLKNRTNQWDVALVGHSRGGVFAHELSKELVSSERIVNLHTFLIDPTAATTWGDVYPQYKPSSNKTKHIARSIIDGNPFIDRYGIGLTTFSDQPITGYTNATIPGTSHSEIPGVWLKGPEIKTWMQGIINRKTTGSFQREEDIAQLNVFEVTIKIDQAIVLDGGITIDQDHIEVWGALEVGPLSSSGYFYLDGNGAVVSTNILINSASLSINEDSIKMNQSNGSESYGASLENQTVTASTTGFYGSAGTTVSVGQDGVNVSIRIFNNENDIITIDDEEDLATVLVTGVAGKSADTIKKIGSSIGRAIGL